MLGSRRRSSSNINAWPGYVDALSALLLLVIFMLLIFTLAQVFLAETVSDRDQELNRLNARLAEISDALRIQRATNEDLSQRLTTLRSQYNQSLQVQQGLEEQIAALEETITTDRETIEVQLREKASLQQDIVALRQLRADLEQELAVVVATLSLREADIDRLQSELSSREALVGSLRDRTQALEARLADERERTLLAQRQIEQREFRIEDLVAIVEEGERALEEERELSASARADVRRLSQQIEDLQTQLGIISAALRLEEDRTAQQETLLEDLGQRLNTLLAQRVTELEQYRSEFFGRLRQVLIDNPNIRIEGDRFLLPSELFFDSGSATLNAAGQSELDKLAETLLSIAVNIPDDLEWILRIDGHTDIRPISTERFPSNWELSTARAVSVVRYLAGQGITPDRMAAAGFGEYHPIDERETEEAFALNRRIEIKLTNR
ncbi:MAG: peptidoglycan-binding protein [Saccharospirillum sp.]|nr:peptidoglycan-binding protein [Saccharospirillum sp.]